MSRLPASWKAITILIALVLFLAPLLAALPDETTWMQTFHAGLLSVFVMLAVILAVIKPLNSDAPPGEHGRRAAIAFAALIGWALLTMAARLIVQHGAAFLGVMLHGWSVLVVDFSLFWLTRRIMRANRTAGYSLLITVVVSAALVSAIGFREYMGNVRTDPGWRVFATSTPDFLAGFLILALPITVAMFRATLVAPQEYRLIKGLCGLFALTQLATLLITQSRFAIVSLAVSCVVFAVGLFRGRTGGKTSRSIDRRLIPIGVVTLLVVCALAKPVGNRLLHPQANSGAFRTWTMKGEVNMFRAHPIAGTGIGTWNDFYPVFQLTGPTRLGHNSYLQMADECGLPGLLALLATLGLAAYSCWRALSRANEEEIDPEVPQLAPVEISEKKDHRGRIKQGKTIPQADERIRFFESVLPEKQNSVVLVGILAALAASTVQNVIDSDWYVYFLGTTFWGLAGIGVGLAERCTPRIELSHAALSPKLQPLLRVVVGVGAALLLALFVRQTAAVTYGQFAVETMAAAYPAAAKEDYLAAQMADPWNGQYPSDLGYLYYAKANGNYPAAEEAIRTAIALEPNGKNYHRLGEVLLREGRTDLGLAAYRMAVTLDPKADSLLLDLAQVSPPDQAYNYYKQIADLEDSPVGQVRAIGEVTDVNFACADAALGQAAEQAGHASEAINYYKRATQGLEKYAYSWGTINGEWQALHGGKSNPKLDAQMRDLYSQVMTSLIKISPPAEQPTLQQQKIATLVQFGKIVPA